MVTQFTRDRVELPNNWRPIPLRSVCLETELVDPTRTPAKPFQYVDVSAVSNALWRIEGSTEHSGSTAPSRARKRIRADDVIFATVRPTLRRVAIVPGHLDGEIASTAFCVLRADPSRVDPRFLYYTVLTDQFIERVANSQRGASYPAVTDSDVFRQEIALPPLPEQRSIATVLSKIQAAVEVRDKIVSTLKELKAATMAKLFREGLRGEPTKETEIGEIPESWDVVRLGDVARIERGKFAHRPRNAPEFYGGAIPFIQTGDVARCNGRIRSYSQTLNEKGLAISRVFPKGTIVLTIAANIADTGILEFDSAFPDSLVGIVPNETMDAEFLEYNLRIQKGPMDRLAPKGTQKNINIQFLKPWPTPRPRLDEQREIARTLRSLDYRLDAAMEARDAFRALFSSMLHLLMTGQVRVRGVVAEGGEETVKQAGVDGSDEFRDTVELFVAEVVRRFGPERVILFGEHAEGSPKAFGEVGLLVEMEFDGLARDQAARMARDIPHDFSLDLVVRRPEEVGQAVEIGDAFIKRVLKRGRVLYLRSGGTPDRRTKAPRKAGSPRRGRVSEETIQEIVRRIVETVQPERIILFGSAARGEMGPDSDLDFLVVKACANRREVAQAIYRNLRGIGVPKDIVVVTPEDVERDRDTIGYIIRPALREGRVVYAA